MNTHPEHWYIQLTPENHEEVKAWWLKQVEKSGWVGRNLYNSCLILSKHPWDRSFYWSDGGFSFKKAFPSYQEITIEQFRQITNTNNMNTLPTNWCIEATEENFAELYPWWRANASESFKVFAIGFTLMSSHPDGSCYFSNCEEQCVKFYPNYQPITIEQFRQITNTKPMNILPTKWLIEVTEENQKELDRWRQQVATEYRERTLYIGYTLLSKHCGDNSCYYTGDANAVRSIEEYADYQEITLEQFRQITNSNKMKHPKKWYIVATEDNYSELEAWRQTVATDCLASFRIGHPLLSKHPRDDSYYYRGCGDSLRCNSEFDDYQEITIEQFRQIINTKPMSKSIQISRTLLNEYYDAATTPQREYLTKHFKLDGTTTDEAIRGLHDLACSTWKPKIKANHPECFPEESKYFDFSKHTNLHGYHNIVSSDVAHSLGLCRNFIQVRNSDTKNSDRSFYLTSDYNWELVKEGGSMVLIPTKR